MPENNDLIGGMKNTNRAARAARTSVEFLDVVCQTTKWNFQIKFRFWRQSVHPKLNLSLIL